MASVDYFLKIDGIEGESQDAKHKGEIEVLSYHVGHHQTGTHAHGGGGGAGKVEMNDFHFVARHSKASPKLMLACADGDHLKTAVLTCRKAGKEQQEYLKITLTALLVSRFHTGDADSIASLTGRSSVGELDAIPVDYVNLNYAKIEYEYKEQKPDGTVGGAVKAGWDVKANKKV
jgi:type VI secretion system secreted protein Hcp